VEHGLRKLDPISKKEWGFVYLDDEYWERFERKERGK
jgi:hypothetical protein